MASVFTACADSSASSESVSKAADSTSSEPTAAATVTSAAPTDETDGLIADEDTSIHFASFEELIGSDELYSRMKAHGADIEKLSEPEIDETLQFDGDIVMYESCFYAYYTDSTSGKAVTVSLCFDKVNDLDGMKAFFEDLFNSDADLDGSYEADDERKIIIDKGNHTSLYRVSEDGLLYCIFSEDMTDDELMTCLDKIKF